MLPVKISRIQRICPHLEIRRLTHHFIDRRYVFSDISKTEHTVEATARDACHPSINQRPCRSLTEQLTTTTITALERRLDHQPTLEGHQAWLRRRDVVRLRGSFPVGTRSHATVPRSCGIWSTPTALCRSASARSPAAQPCNRSRPAWRRFIFRLAGHRRQRRLHPDVPDQSRCPASTTVPKVVGAINNTSPARRDSDGRRAQPRR